MNWIFLWRILNRNSTGKNHIVSHKRHTPQTSGLLSYWKKKLKTAKAENNQAEIERAKERINELYAKLRDTPCFEAIDEKYKKIQYTRYADDFIIGVIGSKEDAEIIKKGLEIS